MGEEVKRRIIDTDRYKALQDQHRTVIRQDPLSQETENDQGGYFGQIVTRAKLRVIENQLKEARLGRYTVYSDEPQSRGGIGDYPSPLQYFIAAIGF